MPLLYCAVGWSIVHICGISCHIHLLLVNVHRIYILYIKFYRIHDSVSLNHIIGKVHMNDGYQWLFNFKHCTFISQKYEASLKC